MDLQTLVTLTTGITLLTCVLGVMGLHAYAMGKAQR
jgi:tight adherence protein B